MKLSGKTAVITGGNSGIGFGIAKTFAEEGARGVIIGRNSKTLKQAGEQLAGAFTPLQLDVTQIDELAPAFKDVKRQYGGIDILVVNAEDRSYDVARFCLVASVNEREGVDSRGTGVTFTPGSIHYSTINLQAIQIHP
jgi:NAD(P)-dependent dehydrogenase (short-subunit alcohol dehydrogenase family)